MSAPRVVAVLSGGGAKAAAHIGALRALHDFDLPPVHFVGTSMGAVVAAAFASGLSYDQVLRRMLAVQRRDVALPSAQLLLGPFAESMLRARPLKQTIAGLVPARSFRELGTPLSVTAVDARNGQLVVFGAGGRLHAPLVDALYASCALPVYYPPGRVGDRDYVDGGVRAVLPVDLAARFRPDLVIAVHVGPWLLDEPPDEPAARPGLLEAHDRAVRILMAAQAEATVARWRANPPVPFVFVKPKAQQRATFRVAAAAHHVAEGYRATVRALHEWRASGPERGRAD